MLPRHGLGRTSICEIKQRPRSLQQSGLRRIPSELLEVLSLASGQLDEHATSRGVTARAILRTQPNEVRAPKGYPSAPRVRLTSRDKLFLSPRTVVVKK